MIAIDKDFEDIPPIIKHKPRKDAFLKNQKAGKYASSDNLYKPKKVKEALDKIYHRKCAYCEKSLKDADRHVEHYRPKVPYYWLAFSWDNLLIACKKCNELKSNKFHEYIEGKQLIYNNETLETAQNQIKHYDSLEKPLIINPEQETKTSLQNHFTFNLKTAEIIPLTKRMETTIDICQLNRKELVEKRYKELERLKNHFIQDLDTWQGKEQIRERVKAISSTIKKFKSNFEKPESPFIAWQLYVVSNWKIISSSVQKK